MRRRRWLKAESKEKGVCGYQVKEEAVERFRQKGNFDVLSTRFVLFEKDPIIYVYYQEEQSMWEFIGIHSLEESDYRVVSIDEILEIDLTILELVGLTTDTYACRESKGAKWCIDIYSA
ncbi:hypothetical protein RYH73_08035 [Olivibacter sp. CPCC 100613]|uniref:hypothetical protein n=1 Tax=Olivibacter sp. CPCC 100613 TaxID=3079931 RepID=UPI002FF4915D